MLPEQKKAVVFDDGESGEHCNSFLCFPIVHTVDI